MEINFFSIPQNLTITALASAKVAIPNPLQPRVPERSNMCLLKLFQNWHFWTAISLPKLNETGWNLVFWAGLTSSTLIQNFKFLSCTKPEIWHRQIYRKCHKSIYITALASAKVAIFSPLQRRVPEPSNKFFWFLAKNRIFERPYLRF